MSITPCPRLIHLLNPLLHLELGPHQAKALDHLFQGSSPRWIQTKSVLAQKAVLTPTLALLGQMAFLEAVQDLEGTLARERSHIIKAQGAHLPPATIQETAAASEANHLAILDRNWKLEAVLKATTGLPESLDKVQASARGCRTWAPEAI